MVKISSIIDATRPDRFCSIDASTNSIAFAIFDHKELEKYGKIVFKGANTYDKVVDAARKTTGVMKIFSVDSIVIEHTVFMNSPKTAADLALVQGGVLGAAGAQGARVSGSVSPITWQTFINNGKLSVEEKSKIVDNNPGKSKSWYKSKERELRKQKTINFVNTYYDVNVSDDDVADAVAIGHYAIHNWDKIQKG
jgi:Holliday junction resolvasome RuvABC endonuclease subunit